MIKLDLKVTVFLAFNGSLVEQIPHCIFRLQENIVCHVYPGTPM